jgi:hypothetical protein
LTLKSIHLFLALVMLLALSNVQASSLPEFCQQNFPVLDRSLIDSSVGPHTYTNADGGEHFCLKTHLADLEVSVPANDILRFYSDVQRVEYARAAESFRRAMKEKVLRSLVQSMQPYEGLFQRQSCSDLGGSGRSGLNNRNRCERAQNIIPQCRNPELNAIIQEEDQLFIEKLEAKARNTLTAEFVNAGHAENTIGDFPPEQLRAAELYHTKVEKEAFIRRNIEASVVVSALLDKKKAVQETFRQEMRRNEGSVSIGAFEFGDPSNELAQQSERRRVLEQNHEIEMQQIQLALGQLYQEYPTVLNVANSTRFLLFSNSDYELSPYATNLIQRFKAANPDFNSDLSSEEISENLRSEEFANSIRLIAEAEIENPTDELENLGREQVFAELSKKREAIEMLCHDNPQNLHHFERLAHEFLEESARSQSSDLTTHQAGYCYLAQSEPPRDGSLPLGATVIAGVAVVGGVAFQFIPVIGNAIGGASIAYGIATVGGAVLAANSYSRYSSALTSDSHTQAVYHGGRSWVTPQERMESEDNLRTQRNIAIAEIGLTAVDGLVLARPAMRLLRSSIPRPPAASAAPRVASEAVTAPRAVSIAPIADQAPRLPAAQAPLPAAGVQPSLPPPPANINRSPVAPHVTAPPVPRISSAQREALEQFQLLAPNERAQRIAQINNRLRAGQVDETEFLITVMNRGGYTPEVFSQGPQGMAINLMNSLDDQESALRVVREFYRAKPSARSQRRLSELEALITDIRPSAAQTARAVTTAPTVVDAAPAGLRLTRSPTADVAPIVPRRSLSATTGLGRVGLTYLSEPPERDSPVLVDTEVPPLIPPEQLEIIVQLQLGQQVHDPDLGFRQTVTARASVRTGESLPSDFQFSWRAIQLDGEDSVQLPNLSHYQTNEILAPISNAPYAIVATGTSAHARVGESPTTVIRMRDIPANLSISKNVLNNDEVELEVTAIVSGGNPPPSLTFNWTAPGLSFLTGEKIRVPRREANYTVTVNADRVDGYHVSSATAQIPAQDEEDDLVPSPSTDPEEEDEDTNNVVTDQDPSEWTVDIKSVEVIPDTATMKVTLEARAIRGNLPSSISLRLESYEVLGEEGDPPSLPSAQSGTEVEFTIPLVNHAYGITAHGSSGDNSVTGESEMIFACFDVATAVCPTEDGEDSTVSEPPLPPGQPPQRFSPLQVPTPQMFVVPGFF